MTQGEFLANLQKTKQMFASYLSTCGLLDDSRRELASLASQLTINMLLNAMGVKTREEGYAAFVDRVQANPGLILGGVASLPSIIMTEEMDIMNAEHRSLLANAIRQMFKPLGVTRILMLGLTEDEEGSLDGATFVAQIVRDGRSPIDNLKEFFEQLATGLEDESGGIVL